MSAMAVLVSDAGPSPGQSLSQSAKLRIIPLFLLTETLVLSADIVLNKPDPSVFIFKREFSE